MDPNTLIPTPDTIPAPSWLFIVLEQLLFLLHILVVNAVVGGFLILLFQRLFRKETENTTSWQQPIAKKLPILVALGINFGIPPLLFLQVVYGHLFYSSSVLMATYWILIIPVLILAYYGAYIHSAKFVNAPWFSKSALAVAAIFMLYIGYMLVNNNSLMEQPEKWTAYFENRSGTILNSADVAFLPRYFHFIAASVAIGGLLFALVYKYGKTTGREMKEGKIKWALRVFAIATAIQMVVGFWYLLVIPADFLPKFMGKDIFSTIFLMVGIFAGIGALVFGFLGNLKATIAHVLLTMVAMLITRYNLRMMYLGDNFQLTDLTMNPQYGVLILFLVILLIGVGSIIYMLNISSTKSEGRVS
ncbi:MAG: hypothetical protein JW731_08675 [Bacteroidales bacterium]|nr:hypothetical protein [Bacteroidales bacterium]